MARDYLSIDIESIKQGVLSNIKEDNGLFKEVHTRFPRHVQNLIIQIRIKHYSIRTEHAYLGWFLRYVKFHQLQDPSQLIEDDISKFLEYLVITRKVSSSTQSQALNAMCFFYKHVLHIEFSENIAFIRSKKPKRLPVVLSKSEIRSLFANIDEGAHKLMAQLLYGCGMRLMECVRLRVLDVDFSYEQIMVREAKGKKDRVVPMPKKIVFDLRKQIERVKK